MDKQTIEFYVRKKVPDTFNSREPFQATQRHAYEGECVAFIKATASTGKIVIGAETQGLASGTVTINATN